MAGYGFDEQSGMTDMEAAAERRRNFVPTAGLGGVTYLPTSSRRTIDVNRPESTTQSQSTSGTSKQDTSQVTTTEFTGERPGKFEQPEWSEGDIKKRSAEIAAPQIRQLRQGLQQALVKHYENPNVRKMMVRSALQGYGIGLGSITAKARSAAASEYAQKYSFDMQAAMADFNAAWNEYMGAKKVTSTGTSEGTTTGEVTGTTGYDYTDYGDNDIYTGPAFLNPSLSSRRNVWSPGRGISGGMLSG